MNSENKSQNSMDGRNNSPSEEGNTPASMESAHETPEIDPVCKMKVLPTQAAAVWQFKEKKYYFCNPGCKTKFQANPELYLPVESTVKSSEPDTVSIEHGHGAGQANTDASMRLRSFYMPEGAFTFSCPMHPEIRQTKPGDCPICGMALEAEMPSSQFQETEELKDLKRRLRPSAIFTLILLIIAMPPMFGIEIMALPHQFMPYVELLLSLPVVIYGARPIFKKAIESGKSGHLNMFSLIAFGITISMAVSLWSLFFAHNTTVHEMLYFESAASITTLVLFGQVLESAARGKSSNSLESLFALAPSTARREISPDRTETIPVFEIAAGDLLRVLPGDKIPVDATVVSGQSSTDESLLSGNSLPVDKNTGDRVYAGSINGEGVLLIKAESLGRDTIFAQIIQLLAKSQRSRSPMQEVADRVSAIFIPAVLAIAFITFMSWYFLAGKLAIAHAIKNTINVLVIACPCALGLATPIAVSLAVARAARFGLMVKDARALEMLGRATKIFFDKTGTLTHGKFELTNITCLEESSQLEKEALYLAASLEQESKHPIAEAILSKAKAEGITPRRASQFQSKAGLGLRASLDGRELILGNRRFLSENGIETAALESRADGASTVVFIAAGGKLLAKLVLEDKLKLEAKEVLETLSSMSVKPGLLSGDAENSVRSTAEYLRISDEDLGFGLMPQDKVARIDALKSRGEVIAMVGDGVNDAAALAAADAGIAMASGSDVALSSAAITAMNSDLKLIVSGLRLSRKLTGTMKENLFLAFIYNIAALFLATGALYPSCGIELNPAIAAAAMSLSSISVILNSLKISRFS